MSVALCAHRFPDGTFCKHRALDDSRFCGHHKSRTASAYEPERHHDVHPLARLAKPEDVFNVVRETLNAVRQGRVSPGQAYAVGYLAEVWLRVDRQMNSYERERALESQYLPKVLETEEKKIKSRRTPLPLPVKIDQPAAMAQLDAIAEPLNLKPASDYPGEPGYIPPADPPVDEVDALPRSDFSVGAQPSDDRDALLDNRGDSSVGVEPREGRKTVSPGRKPWVQGRTQIHSSLPLVLSPPSAGEGQAVAEAAGPEQHPGPGTNDAGRDALLQDLLHNVLGPLKSNGRGKKKRRGIPARGT